MRVFVFMLFFIFGGFSSIYAQSFLQGKVVDTLNLPIAYVSLQIGRADQTLRTIYTDEKGQFKYVLPDNVKKDSLWIEAKHISYQTKRFVVTHWNEALELKLSEQARQLEDVIIKSKPLAMRSAGDTVRYAVSQFVSAEDRNIGDVLKRMPGVTVDEAGGIKYNGQNISGMYVDGDHVFNNGYGIGTRTIQPKLIKDVEILKNHQHKKMNASEASDQVALNLVLEEDAKMVWSGEGTAGGAAPLDVYGQGNALSFKKDYKTINSLQLNSVGENINQDVQRIQAINLVEPIHASAPSLPLQRYYNNASFALNMNHHYKFSPIWNTHVNGVLWRDQEHLQSSSLTTYLIDPAQPVQFNHQVSTRKSPLFGQGVWEVEGNHNAYYFKNKFNWRGQRAGSQSELQDQGIDVQQRGFAQDFAMSESLEFSKRFPNRNSLQINFQGHIEKHQDQAEWTPGLIPSQAKVGESSRIWQGVQTPERGLQGQIQYTLGQGKINKGLNLGGKWEHKSLQSQAKRWEDGGWQLLDGFENQLNWGHQQGSLGLHFHDRTRKWMWSAQLPLQWNRWHLQDPIQGIDRITRKVMFSPSGYVQYALPSNDHFRLNVGMNNGNAQLQQLYQAPILANFRSMNRQDIPMYFTTGHQAALQFTMERPITLFNARFGVSYAYQQMDYLSDMRITQQGFVQTMIPYRNHNKQFSFEGHLAKADVLRKLYTNLQMSTSHQQYESMYNGEIAPSALTQWSVIPRLEYKKLSFASFSYAYGWQYSWSERGKQGILGAQAQWGQSHELSGLFFLNKVNGRLTWTHQMQRVRGKESLQNGFLDAKLWTNIGSSKNRLELQVNNLLNKRKYSTYTYSPTQQSEFHYPLRGVQGVLKYSFLF
jgi:hypothetical protein